MDAIDHTTVYCRDCGAEHSAQLVHERNGITGIVDCPRGVRRHRLSSDAAFFLMTRQRSFLSNPDLRRRVSADRGSRRMIANFISLTNTCNYRCPVCFASSGDAEPLHIGIEDFRARVERLKRDGRRRICLFGGEPTMHPQLPELISIAERSGIRCILITNGQRIGAEPGYLPTLVRAGLKEVHLQFDSLNPEHHRMLRGNDCIPDKLRAVERILNAGLALELVVTVTRFTLEELPRMLAFALELGPGVRSVMFQGVVERGRFGLAGDAMVDREEILAALGGGRYPLAMGDFWPLPASRPWGIAMHPDCVVYSLINVAGGHVRALPWFFDLRAIYRWLHRDVSGPGILGKYLRPLWAFAVSVRGVRFLSLLVTVLHSLRRRRIRIDPVTAVVTGGGGRHLLLVLVESYSTVLFDDCERIQYCPSQQVLADRDVCACEYNCRGPEFPFSRVDVESRGGL